MLLSVSVFLILPHNLQGWNIYPYKLHLVLPSLHFLHSLRSFATYFVLFIIPDKFKTHFLQIIHKIIWWVWHSGSRIKRGTRLDNIRDFKIATLPSGDVFLTRCWTMPSLLKTFHYIYNSFFLQSFRSCVNHIPNILNWLGFQTIFKCGIYLICDRLLLAN